MSLTGKKLVGSGVSLKGFNTLESAVSHFCTASSLEITNKNIVTILSEDEVLDVAIARC